MKYALRSAIAIVTACMPIVTMAAAPANVRDVRAEVVAEGVKVSWSKVDGDVAAYRIFYSHASILENDGLYDDFESADGTVDSHILKSAARGGDFYVSVLAVNAQGEESALFLEEASVTVPEAMAASSSSSSIAMQPLASDELRLLSAESVSATGVTLTFSHPITIPAAQAASAIVMRNASGGILPMKRFVIQGNIVMVHTLPQERNVPYRVTIGQGVTAKVGDATISIAADQSPMLFAGHADGITPGSYKPIGSSASSATADGMKAEVIGLQLRAQAEGTAGAYTVEATWQAPAGSVDAYLVSQTRNRGMTYGQAARVEGGATVSVKIRGVPAGDFGIMVKTAYVDGTVSRGVAQAIVLPGTGGSSSSKKGGMTGSVTGKDPGALPNSGPALWILTGIAGSIAGYWQARPKRTA